MTNKAITIIDIAKLLGVSKSTVSRALKDHPDISNATKEAVRMMAKQLKYKPNAVAMSLRHKKSKVIGLIVPTLSPFFFPSVIHGIENEVNKRGYNLMILQSNESYEREVHNVDILQSNNVEGILASVSRNTEDLSHFTNLIENNTPIVFFDRIPKSIQADMVLVDDISGAYNAVEHLISIGKRKIAICLGNPNLLISSNRLNGYKKALKKHQIEINEEFIITGQSSEEAEKETKKLLELTSPPDAILAISDLTMSGIMKALYASKIKIPEDIAVIGFCEDTFSQMYNPPVSTIDPMGIEIGKIAAERLFQRIHENNILEPKIINLSSRLIVRDSTKA
ncbi:MAG: LacI family DNA-binding transcriptional regulator [Marinifilaceae bacterium]|nr:LacI family DNA-binding transcriptional regulator [Marinifilaceae bacterium]